MKDDTKATTATKAVKVAMKKEEVQHNKKQLSRQNFHTHTTQIVKIDTEESRHNNCVASPTKKELLRKQQKICWPQQNILALPIFAPFHFTLPQTFDNTFSSQPSQKHKQLFETQPINQTFQYGTPTKSRLFL